MSQSQLNRVAIIGGMRTPFVKAGMEFSKLPPLALSAHAVQGLIDQLSLNTEMIDDLVWGRVIHDPRLTNLAREIVFKLDLPATIRALLVSNNCISGIHALVAVADAIALGRSEAGIAGGVESTPTGSTPWSLLAVGHPFAATDARIVTTLANEMQRRQARYGLLSICAAGAMAVAMILERPALPAVH